MRTRLLLGGVATAFALSVAPQPASATSIYCEPGFEAACVVLGVGLGVLCKPKLVTC